MLISGSLQKKLFILFHPETLLKTKFLPVIPLRTGLEGNPAPDQKPIALC